MSRKYPQITAESLCLLSLRSEGEAKTGALLPLYFSQVLQLSNDSYFHTYKCKFLKHAALPKALTEATVQIKVLRGVTTTTKHKLVADLVADWLSLSLGSPIDIFIAKPIVDQILPDACIATLLYQKGSILHYCRQHPDMDRRPIVVDCARALAYVHTKGIVHGNIRANNFLMGDDGHAYMSDIGIHEALCDYNFTSAWRYRRHSTACKEDACLETTMADDVHSFAMMMYELYTGEKPFPHLKDNARTIIVISAGLPPLLRPQNMPEDIWALVQRCIDDTKPRTMEEIVQYLAMSTN